MGNCNIWPPYRINTPQTTTKKFVTGDYVDDPYSWAKFLANLSKWEGLLGEWMKYNQFFLIYTFFLELTYRWDPSMDFRVWWLKWCGLVQGCAFLGFVDITPHFGGQIPQDGCILKMEKPQYRGNSIIDDCQIWHSDAYWPSPCYSPFYFWIFKNPRWRTVAVLKIEKSQYLCNGITDPAKFRTWCILINSTISTITLQTEQRIIRYNSCWPQQKGT